MEKRVQKGRREKEESIAFSRMALMFSIEGMKKVFQFIKKDEANPRLQRQERKDYQRSHESLLGRNAVHKREK